MPPIVDIFKSFFTSVSTNQQSASLFGYEEEVVKKEKKLHLSFESTAPKGNYKPNPLIDSYLVQVQSADVQKVESVKSSSSLVNNIKEECELLPNVQCSNSPSNQQVVLLNFEGSLEERWEQLKIAYFGWENEQGASLDQLTKVKQEIPTKTKKVQNEITTFRNDCEMWNTKARDKFQDSLQDMKKQKKEYLTELKKKIKAIETLLSDPNPANYIPNIQKFNTLFNEIQHFLKYKPILEILEVHVEGSPNRNYEIKKAVYDCSVLVL